MGQLDIFGSEIHEYLFVIEPDQKTTEQLIQFRALINGVIPLTEEILHSKPHISICYFEASNFSDDYILSKAKQALNHLKSFDIQLNNAEIWKNGTLVLKVSPNENTLELQHQLSGVFKGIIKNLHLTIARNLTGKFQEQFSMEKFNCKNTFKCESISLLQKKEHKPYRVLGRIYLKEAE